MNISIINNSSYCITLMKGELIACILNIGESFFLDIQEGDNITIRPQEKNQVIFNFVYALIDGFISEDSVINSLVCSENIYFTDINENCLVEIKDFECAVDEIGFIYDTVKVELFGNMTVQTSYQIEDTRKEYKKTKLLLYLVSSWLPIIFALLIVSFLIEDIIIFLALIPLFLFFTVPSFIKAKKIKKYYRSDYVNEVILLELEKEKNPVSGQNVMNKIIDDAVNNIMDKFFKKK